MLFRLVDVVGAAAVKIGSTLIDDTFAEAFGMRFARVVVTAADDYWLSAALREFTGYSASVIACDAETGVEQMLDPAQTPDGRPGAAVLLFGFSADSLGKVLPNRVGQCLMTCPTTAVFDGLTGSEQRVAVGKHIRFFGDGYQKSKQLEGVRYWRIPVMDGEFMVVESVGIAKGVAGGNIILQACDGPAALQAARRAAESLARPWRGSSHRFPAAWCAAAVRLDHATRPCPLLPPTPTAPPCVVE